MLHARVEQATPQLDFAAATRPLLGSLVAVARRILQDEIAMSPRMLIGTARSKVNRARKSLREMLIHNMPDEYLIRPTSRAEST
jgi:hypothetical protein